VNTSEKIDLIAPALVATQRQLRPVRKTAENPHFKSSFAPLDEIMDAAQTAAHANGIAILQSTDGEDAAGFNLVTTLLHTSGQWVAGRVRMPLERGTAQAAGSATTYGRRYGLAALLGIVAEDDDDGHAATVQQALKPAKVAKGSKAKKPLKERTEIELLDLRVWAEREGKDGLVQKINDEMERRRDADLSELPAEIA